MKLDLSNNKKNENKNVQPAAQVNNNANVMHEVDVTGLMTALKTNGRAKLSEHFKDAEVVEPIEETKPDAKTKPTPKKGNPAPKAALSRVKLVTYQTKNGDTAPRIIGFSGEDDPRWKPVNDEKKMLVEEYKKAKAKDGNAKPKSSPFGPAWLTDKEKGKKTYCMTFGTKYMDVAKALCEAYNTADKMKWHKAEDAVRAQKKSIAESRKAERAAKKAEEKASADEKEKAMFELFKKFMAGDKETMKKVGEMIKKAA